MILFCLLGATTVSKKNTTAKNRDIERETPNMAVTNGGKASDHDDDPTRKTTAKVAAWKEYLRHVKSDVGYLGYLSLREEVHLPDYTDEVRVDRNGVPSGTAYILATQHFGLSEGQAAKVVRVLAREVDIIKKRIKEVVKKKIKSYLIEQANSERFNLKTTNGRSISVFSDITGLMSDSELTADTLIKIHQLVLLEKVPDDTLRTTAEQASYEVMKADLSGPGSFVFKLIKSALADVKKSLQESGKKEKKNGGRNGIFFIKRRENKECSDIFGPRCDHLLPGDGNTALKLKNIGNWSVVPETMTTLWNTVSSMARSEYITGLASKQSPVEDSSCLLVPPRHRMEDTQYNDTQVVGDCLPLEAAVPPRRDPYQQLQEMFHQEDEPHPPPMSSAGASRGGGIDLEPSSSSSSASLAAAPARCIQKQSLKKHVASDHPQQQKPLVVNIENNQGQTDVSTLPNTQSSWLGEVCGVERHCGRGGFTIPCSLGLFISFLLVMSLSAGKHQQIKPSPG